MKLGADHHIPTCACPACGKPHDGACGIETDDCPKPGDVTVCIYCGHLMAFNADLMLRELTGTEAHEIAGDARILAVQRARKAVKDK
jgi:hypothetical protein